jgi:hypothetical protein
MHGQPSGRISIMLALKQSGKPDRGLFIQRKLSIIPDMPIESNDSRNFHSVLDEPRPHFWVQRNLLQIDSRAAVNVAEKMNHHE